MLDMLAFMKDYLEERGLKTNQAHFDFSPSDIQYYINNLPDYIPEGEDLQLFKSKTNYSNELITKAINIAKSREY